jgi:hypothetical protein
MTVIASSFPFIIALRAEVTPMIKRTARMRDF